MLPMAQKCDYSANDIIVLDFESDCTKPDFLPTDNIYNAVVRLNIGSIDKFSQFLMQHYHSFKRINFIWKDTLNASETDLNNFRLALKRIEKVIFKIFTSGYNIDISLATDRIHLSEMNNCDAGITHFTIAPNGKFYICPAFYYENPSETIGSLETGEILINNQHLLQLDYAPICRNCDAYQCKRCVFQNQKSTLELNTPSHEQCVVAHHERNMSGMLLERLQKRGVFSDKDKIHPLFYLDPIELILNK